MFEEIFKMTWSTKINSDKKTYIFAEKKKLFKISDTEIFMFLRLKSV